MMMNFKGADMSADDGTMSFAVKLLVAEALLHCL